MPDVFAHFVTNMGAHMEESCTSCNRVLVQGSLRRRCLDCVRRVQCFECASAGLGACPVPGHVLCEESLSPEFVGHMVVQAALTGELDMAFCAAMKLWERRPVFATLQCAADGAWRVGPYQTFGDLYSQAVAVAEVFASSGCTVVALTFQGNSQLLYTLEAACVLARVHSCCIPTGLSEHEWHQCATEAGVTLAIVGGELKRALQVAETREGSVVLPYRVVDADAWSLDALRSVVVGVAAAAGAGTGPCLIKYSSGSTGRPKGIRHRCPMEFLRLRLNVLPSVVLSCYPPCWSTDTSVVWAALLHGARVVFGNPRAMDVLDMHAVVRPTSVALTPFLAAGLQRVYAAAVAAVADAAGSGSPRAMLAGALAVHAQLGGRCRNVTVGGAMTSGALVQFLKSVLPCRVTESYGTSETHGITLDGRLEAGVEVKLGPLPGVSDPDVGEVCVRCSNTVRPEDWVGDPPLERYLPDGFLRTGDVGRLCPVTGTLKVLGRIGNAVKLPTGVFFCPESLEKLLVPAVPGIKAAVVTVDSSGNVVVSVTPVDAASLCSDACLEAIAHVAHGAGLPVPTRLTVKDLPELVQEGGTWKPRKPPSLQDEISKRLGHTKWPTDKPMRDVGLDSLGAMSLAPLFGPAVTFTTILSSTLQQLEAIVMGDAGGGGASGGGVPAAGVSVSPPPVAARAVIGPWKEASGVGSAAGKVVFVTGGTGFVGQGIVAALLARADVKQVVCLVRAASIIPDVWKQEAGAAAAASALSRIVWVVGDVALAGLGLDAAAAAADVVPTEVYGVIHAAADVVAYGLEAIPLLQGTNVAGTAHVLAFAAQRAAVHVVHVSSGSAEHPTASAYAATKAAAEDVVKPWAGGGKPAVIARLPLILGDNREDWLHRMVDAARELGARPACDCLYTRPVWTMGLADCSARLAQLACEGDDLQREFVPMESSPRLVADLLRTCWPTIDDDLPAVNDSAWTHAARGGTRFAPCASQFL